MKIFETNYTSNLLAISKASPVLHEKLSAFEENSRFEPVLQADGSYNIKDNQTNKFFYNTTTQEMFETFYAKREYPFLYFFGIGNGALIKKLLEQKKHNITVIEPSIELLFVALHLEDFSEELISTKLNIYLQEDFLFADSVFYFNEGVRIYYARSYELFLASPYYEELFEKNFIEINKLIVDLLEFIITNSGNDVKDALMGVEHHVYNIPRMVSGTQFERFKKQKNANTVVMVSTGPSLTKQLPLLKSIQKHATIICADSALRILYANDITPDICVSLERIPYVTELFKDLPSKYKQKVIFVRASLEHKSVFKTLEKCHDILVMRPFKQNDLFELTPYGKLCSGTSVANMAHELSAFMDYRHCIIIGQDLSYAKDGTTHSKGHILGEKDSSISEHQEKIAIPAYGGEGEVFTNNTWLLFRNGLVQTVDATKDYMTTINATEGGARIEGTVEMPFKEAIEKYVETSVRKKKIIPEPTSQKEAKHYYKIARKNTALIIKEGRKIQKSLEKAYTSLAKVCKKLENKSEEKQLKIFKDEEIIKLLDLIEKTRAIMENSFYYKKFYWELMQSIVMHYELELANIKIKTVNSATENKQKALAWIFNHSHYFYTLAGMMDGIIFTIEKAQKESIEELPKHLEFLLKR